MVSSKFELKLKDKVCVLIDWLSVCGFKVKRGWQIDVQKFNVVKNNVSRFALRA